MKRLTWILDGFVIFSSAIALAMINCTPQEAKTVNAGIADGIAIGDLICAEESGATTLPAVQAVCAGLATLTPAQQAFIESLLEQKNAAKKVGFAWPQKTDAGAASSAPLKSLPDSGK